MSMKDLEEIPLCNRNCASHRYMVDIIDKLSEVTDKLMEGQADIKENVIRLTENLLESQRVNQRFDLLVAELKAKDEKQEEQIRKNSAFVNKALGLLGGFSILVGFGSLVVAVLSFVFR